MKAAYINRTGPPDSIIYGELPTPDPVESQVLVKVSAVAVNPIDTYVRSGFVPMSLPFPFVVGCDLAGVVLAVGPKVRRVKAGDRVWGSNQGLAGRQGTFATHAAVDEAWLYPIPEGVSDERAAAMALVGITAHLGLVRRAQLQPGETVLVNGGGGAVGSVVVQMAKALGATVLATTSSEAKAEACRQLGAAHVINYSTQNVETALQELVPGGVQVWWETAREPDFTQSVKSLAPRGRLVLMAGREARPAFPVGPFYAKGCSLLGFAMMAFSADEQQASAEAINNWLAAGKLKPKIDRVMHLSEAAAAHRLQEENTIRRNGALAGKIVLKP
jgi:NADPH:quinone reductase